jgi:hypothetical protein
MPTQARTTDWSPTLKAYTKRNAGRRTRLVIDDPLVNAQWEEIDFPLRSISFDRRENRIEIVLGEERGLEAHLTHSIESPFAVELKDGSIPGFEVLCIHHPGGRTRLQFV